MKEIISLCSRAGIKDPEIIRLKGDMSERKIYRVKHLSGTVIAVCGENIPENEAFLSFRETFENNGYRVPSLLAVSGSRKTYLIQDLGNTTVRSYCENMKRSGRTDEIKNIYSRIIRILPGIQTKLFDKIDFSKCYQGEFFDKNAMNRDIGRFEEYFLNRYHKNYSSSAFLKFKEVIISAADAQSSEYFMYRDFQTRNMMLMDDKLYFIDFQSGRKGSFYYDLASFIYSSGTESFKGSEEFLSGIYYSSSDHIKQGKDEFLGLIKSFGCLRIMQALGNYAYFYCERGDLSVEKKMKSGVSALNTICLQLGLECGIRQGTYR